MINAPTHSPVLTVVLSKVVFFIETSSAAKRGIANRVFTRRVDSCRCVRQSIAPLVRAQRIPVIGDPTESLFDVIVGWTGCLCAGSEGASIIAHTPKPFHALSWTERVEQFIFATDQGERLMREILRFLSAP